MYIHLTYIHLSTHQIDKSGATFLYQQRKQSMKKTFLRTVDDADASSIRFLMGPIYYRKYESIGDGEAPLSREMVEKYRKLLRKEFCRFTYTDMILLERVPLAMEEIRPHFLNGVLSTLQLKQRPPDLSFYYGQDGYQQWKPTVTLLDKTYLDTHGGQAEFSFTPLDIVQQAYRIGEEDTKRCFLCPLSFLMASWLADAGRGGASTTTEGWRLGSPSACR